MDRTRHLKRIHMHLRTIDDIFPDYYLGKPDETYLRRTVEAHIECAQLPDDLHLWIDREQCPYMREAYATALMQDLADRTSDPDRAMDSMVRIQVEDALRRIIRHAQAEQNAEELLYAENLTQAPTSTGYQPDEDSHIRALERNVAYLQQEIHDIKRLLTMQQAHDPAYLWPSYTAQATEGDKRTFEDVMHRLCSSTARSATQEIKKYLNLKTKEGIIVRPSQINVEYDYVCRFGYSRTESAYYKA